MSALRAAVVLEQCWHRVPGGTASSVLRACEALRHRPDLDLVGVSARHRHPPPPPWEPSISVRAASLPRPFLYESWHRTRTPSLDGLLGDVQVVWASGYAIPPQSAPLVVTIHDVAWRHDPSQFTKRGVRFFEQALRITVDEADLVHCPSQATAVDLHRAGVALDRIRVIPWGVTMPATHPDPGSTSAERVRRAWGLPDDYLLFVGTIEPRKNLAALIGAWEMLGPDAPDLVLVGPTGWNDAMPSVPAHLRARVHALGFLPEPDLAAVYASARLVCYPSRREGFGLPVLEALSFGTPVVTTKDSAMAELLTDAEGVVTEAGRLCAADAVSIAAGLADLLLETSDVEQRQAISLTAARLAKSYSWERSGDALHQLLRDAAE